MNSCYNNSFFNLVDGFNSASTRKQAVWLALNNYNSLFIKGRDYSATAYCNV